MVDVESCLDQTKQTDVLLIVPSSQGLAVNESNVCGSRRKGKEREGGVGLAVVAHHLSCPHININTHTLPSMSSLCIPRITRRLLYLSVCGRAGDCSAEQTDDETKAGESFGLIKSLSPGCIPT